MRFFVSFLCFLGFFNCAAQTFTLQISNDTSYCIQEWDVDHCFSTITNETQGLLEIDIIRFEDFDYDNWRSGMFAGLEFYPISVDSIRVKIKAQTKIVFMPGFTLLNDNTIEIAKVTYLIRDVAAPSNQIFFDTYGIRSEISTSLKNTSSSNEVLLFPNPTSDYLTIQSDLDINLVQIFNLEGKILGEYGNVNPIDFTKFEKGVYLLKIHTQLGVLTKRFIKI